jgi:hypothetical protein
LGESWRTKRRSGSMIRSEKPIFFILFSPSNQASDRQNSAIAVSARGPSLLGISRDKSVLPCYLRLSAPLGRRRSYRIDRLILRCFCFNVRNSSSQHEEQFFTLSGHDVEKIIYLDDVMNLNAGKESITIRHVAMKYQ